MQPGVARKISGLATVSSVTDRSYWKDSGIPAKLKKAADLLKDSGAVGKSNNTELALEVIAVLAANESKPRKFKRAQFEHIINGKREPYVSQLAAICKVLRVELTLDVGASPPPRQPAISSAKTHKKSQKGSRTGGKSPDST